MKKCTVSILIAAALLSVLLSACQTGEETPEPVSALPYQFAEMYGIIQSEYPVYELDTVIESKLPQEEKTALLTSAIHQDQELLVSMVLEDASEREPDELLRSGEGLFLTGPGIPEAGIKPLESIYASDSAYFEEYGHKRYIIEARFEIPSVLERGDILSGYAVRLLDFEKPLEFALKRVPEYGTLEELAGEEQGGIDTHDGISIITMGERVKEGILVSWYVFSETGESPISITYSPPNQEIDLPAISGDGKQYSIRALSANPYWDNGGHYQLSDIKRYGRRTRCLFDAPQEETDSPLQVNIPGITFLNHEESSPVTLAVPEDSAELNVDIPWNDGSVRILRITRMEEPQAAAAEGRQGVGMERPAVYIDVAAAHESRDLALRGLICQRKSRQGRWEHEPYEFDGNGSLRGFRILYDEGDGDVTLKFNGAAFYWNQPFAMQVRCRMVEEEEERE